MANTIVLVEDDEQLSGLIAEYLEEQGMAVTVIADGADAVAAIVEGQPDLVILDLMLPGKDGISICRECRFGYEGPILMLTASSDALDQILGLEIGADDFVTKPVEPRVLLARVRALLRRAVETEPLTVSPAARTIRVGALTLNTSARSLMLDGNPVELTTTEFEVLARLAAEAGTTVTREDLFQSLRNFEYDGQSRLVDITISQIRKKLGPAGDRYLKTVRGKGYLLVVEAE